MNRRRAAEGFSLQLAMTPMIDVVFLLLVFFVCTVRFERGEAVYQLDLPARGATADPLALQDPPVQVILTSTSISECSIELKAQGVSRRVDDFNALAITLEQLRRRVGSADGLFDSAHPILVVPSPSTPWQHAVEGFNAAVRAGYQNIGFAESRSS
ncbi:MAG: hypothetical protein EXS15_01425 [Phycisphaerales bacterium]|nr:hypothetical protein [Phycisphaerales bacterium]